MAKLYINTVELSKVISSVKSANNYLNQAITKINSMTIPDINDKVNLVACNEDIKKISATVNFTLNWLNDSVTKFNFIDQEMFEATKLLEEANIKTRNIIIK